MKRRLSLIILMLMIIASLFGCSTETSKVTEGDEVKVEEVKEEEPKEDLSMVPLTERKLLRVGTPGQHYPWNFYEGGELKGIDIGTLEEACNRIGYDLEYEIIAFEGLYGSIDAGTTDTGA